MTYRVQKECARLSAIKTEGHFVEIGLKMFRADSMPRSHNAALQERERRLHGVRVDISVNIHAAFMTDGLMFLFQSRPAHGIGIGRPIVSNHDFYVVTHVFSDKLCQRCTLGVFGVEETQIATA